MIQIYEPDIRKYTQSAKDAVDSGWISNHGKYIEKTSRLLADIFKIPYVILMANGTCATHCLFLALQYKYPRVQNIYIPNNCYVAAYNAALMVYDKSQVRILNMDDSTWNMCTDEEYMRSLEPDSAVLVVHNLGNILNVPRLKRIRPDLIFMEDNCEGMFGKYEDVYSGTASLCSSVSFYGNKIITSGEGGAFLTCDASIYNHIKKVYSQGMSETRYIHDVHAYNYRITNVASAFLYDQLNDIDSILKNKRRVFETYELLLQHLVADGSISLFRKEDNTVSADWIFAIRINGNTKETMNFFNTYDVDIRPFFYPISAHAHLCDLHANTNMLNNEIIMIPSSPLISTEEQKKVVDVLYRFIFFNRGFDIVDIREENKNILDTFISCIDNDYFKYYDTRSSDVIQNHLITLILLHKGTCVGYAHVDHEGDYWFGIYIHKEYRGKKIGNLLLNYALSRVNIPEIKLSVFIENTPAIELYKKNNFKVIETTSDKYYMLKNFIKS